MMKWFSSDWHLGHSNVLKFAHRPFETIEQMDDIILENMFKKVRRNDDFYFLGDLFWNFDSFKKFYNILSKKRCRFHWILGNHDLKTIKIIKRNKEYKFKNIIPMMETNVNKNKITLCHYPMITWNRSHYNSWMLFGHHHFNDAHYGKLITPGKMLNVNCEFNNYMPYSEFDIEKIMNNKPNNWDYINDR